MATATDNEPAASSEDQTTLVGRKIQKYDIVRVIGRGGMGTVYEATNTAISKRVAMKFVDVEMSRNKDAVARFQREAQAASAVESAHIVEIFDSGTSDEGLPFIVMEFLRGEDLGHRIKRCGRLELPEAIQLTAQILRGLHRAHAAGIVHRDLKPDNVFLVERDDEADFVKILDFGISKMQRMGDTPVNTLTRQGTVLGTPFYMSPEQAQALPDIDGRTDLWSVGAILYECLTGRPPYSGATYEQVIINICMKDADDVRLHNPEVSEAVAKVLAKALCRERDNRFGASREFLDALISATGGLISSRRGSVADEPTPTPPARSSGRPASSSHTPASGFAPTIEASHPGTSKVGWSTSGRRVAVLKDRRRFVLVGGGALVAGVVGALLYLRDPPGPVQIPVAASPAPASEVSVRLRANVAGAQFWADGAVAKNGLVRGPKGEVKKIRVEAEGFAPRETTVTLGGAPPEQIELTALANTAESPPEVEPAGEPTATAAPTASEAPKARTKAEPRRSGSGAKPKASASPSAVPAAAASPVGPPQPTGVAGGLRLKND